MSSLPVDVYGLPASGPADVKRIPPDAHDGADVFRNAFPHRLVNLVAWSEQVYQAEFFQKGADGEVLLLRLTRDHDANLRAFERDGNERVWVASLRGRAEASQLVKERVLVWKGRGVVLQLKVHGVSGTCDWGRRILRQSVAALSGREVSCA